VRIGIQIKTWRAAFNLEFPTVAKPCITCHGLDGRGRSPGFPNLCGQKSIYMMQQLTLVLCSKVPILFSIMQATSTTTPEPMAEAKT